MEQHIQAWLARDPDAQTRDELRELVSRGDRAALHERFASRLQFGTAGLRGLLGAGPARMNRLVVRESTAGLGAYLIDQVAEARERGVVVGFDGRRGSRVFAEDTASVLGALGIKVYLFDREAPTPVAGFAVRHLRAAAGIVITASHNPPAYNGYKVYWGNGAQIVPPHDRDIAAAIDRAAQASIPWQEPAALRRQGVIVALGEKTERAYLEGVARLSVHRGSGEPRDLVIAYTPLHGVGARFAESALARSGFKHVHTVPEQREADGAFPTVRFPNPEEEGAMDLVMALAQKTQAALACANDPDADRFAVAAPKSAGAYALLTGDQVGALLADDLFRRAPKHAVAATTVVSSRLLKRMCERRGVDYFETLTGFKWIANGAIERTERGQKMVFAYEEALGYAVGDLVWDKDGISALAAFAELAAACASRRETLWQRLETIYRDYGLFVTAQKTLALSERTDDSLGDKLRRTPPQQVAGRKVARAVDLSLQPNELGLPAADVLIYFLEDDTRVIVRPSGTEPKIKCYYEMCRQMSPIEVFDEAEASLRREMQHLIQLHQSDLSSL